METEFFLAIKKPTFLDELLIAFWSNLYFDQFNKTIPQLTQKWKLISSFI